MVPQKLQKAFDGTDEGHSRLAQSESEIDATEIGEESQQAADMLADIQSSLELVQTSSPI